MQEVNTAGWGLDFVEFCLECDNAQGWHSHDFYDDGSNFCYCDEPHKGCDYYELRSNCP
jgi:hypothetical protein